MNLAPPYTPTMTANRAAADESWMRALLFVAAVRAVLTIPALIGAGMPELGEGVLPDPSRDPGTLPWLWVRWDSNHFLEIATEGYSEDNMVFLPAYPALIAALAWWNPDWMAWSGYLASNAMFVLGSMVLWFEVKRHFDGTVAWNSIVLLSLFPMSWAFSAVYAEGLFILASVLVWRFSAQRQWVAASACVAVASVTRIGGILLILIPLVELLSEHAGGWKASTVVVLMGSSCGILLYMMWSWMEWGSPLAYLLVQDRVWKDYIAWPWQTVMDSAAVAAGFAGYADNWFMRVISAQDLTVVMMGIVCTAVGAFWLPRSLFLYSVAAMLLITSAHGPYSLGLLSASRYVLVIFPIFIVLGQFLAETPRLARPSWVCLGTLLIFVTGWFGSGRWVA